RSSANRVMRNAGMPRATTGTTGACWRASRSTSCSCAPGNGSNMKSTAVTLVMPRSLQPIFECGVLPVVGAVHRARQRRHDVLIAAGDVLRRALVPRHEALVGLTVVAQAVHGVAVLAHAHL